MSDCVKCGECIGDLHEYPDKDDIDVCWNCDRGFCELSVPAMTEQRFTYQQGEQ